MIDYKRYDYKHYFEENGKDEWIVFDNKTGRYFTNHFEMNPITHKVYLNGVEKLVEELNKLYEKTILQQGMIEGTNYKLEELLKHIREKGVISEQEIMEWWNDEDVNKELMEKADVNSHFKKFLKNHMGEGS